LSATEATSAKEKSTGKLVSLCRPHDIQKVKLKMLWNYIDQQRSNPCSNMLAANPKNSLLIFNVGKGAKNK